MLLRLLQRAVRLAPSASRTLWDAMPEAARRALSPLVFPVAAGPRSRGRVLAVPWPTDRPRYGVVVSADASFAAVEMEKRGHRVIRLEADADLAAVVRAANVLDAVYVGPPAEEPARLAAARTLGFPLAAGLSAPELDAAFPEVTIIMVTHANREACRAALAAVLRNTPFPGLEILVVDNGSTDGTRAMLEAAARDDARIRVLPAGENLGFARGTNRGLREAQGEIVVLLNDDTAVGPGWLSRLFAHLEVDPNVGLVCPVTNEIGGAARVEAGYETLEEMEAFARRRAFEHAGRRRRVETVALFCAAARRATLERAGWLDERYEVGMFEDDDLSRTLRLRGHELAIADDAFVHHVGQASFSKLSDARYLAVWEANRKRFEDKWGVRWKPTA